MFLLICSPQIEIIHETNDVHRLKYSTVKCRNLILWAFKSLQNWRASGRRFGTCVWQIRNVKSEKTMPFILDSFSSRNNKKSQKLDISWYRKNGMCGKPWDNGSHGNTFQGSTKRYARRIRNIKSQHGNRWLLYGWASSIKIKSAAAKNKNEKFHCQILYLTYKAILNFCSDIVQWTTNG